MAADWYSIDNIAEIDTPALVVYTERVRENIRLLKTILPDTNRLRPHIKTNKSPDATALMISEGIYKYKCATIAEAEMLASAGARDVLLAYQPVGPKADRLIILTRKFPNTTFSCLVDDIGPAHRLNALATAEVTHVDVFIDLNVGMNRTGILPENAEALVNALSELNAVKLKGLHAYDGHIRDSDISVRTSQSDKAFEPVQSLRKKLERVHGPLTVIAGGAPTFPVHARRADVECSPGTFIYWDYGYDQLLPDLPFVFAALVVTRIISKPDAHTVCADLGHKGIASENPLNKRVKFLNSPNLEPIGHSEEHLVLQVKGNESWAVGDVLYGVPYHVCPTCALYDTAWIVEKGRAEKEWSVSARKRTISV